jgi:hypothetical protein
MEFGATPLFIVTRERASQPLPFEEVATKNLVESQVVRRWQVTITNPCINRKYKTRGFDPHLA